MEIHLICSFSTQRINNSEAVLMGFYFHVRPTFWSPRGQAINVNLPPDTISAITVYAENTALLYCKFEYPVGAMQYAHVQYCWDFCCSYGMVYSTHLLHGYFIEQSGRSPKVVALSLLQTLVAIWYDFFNCMIQSKWNQIIQELTIITMI